LRYLTKVASNELGPNVEAGLNSELLMREEFALRSDDGMLGWNLLLAGAGAGVGVGQLVLARRHQDPLVGRDR
jgi:hypothetical protein